MRRRLFIKGLRGTCLIFLVIGPATLTGCGPGKGALSGKVSYQGKPLPGGFITIVPEKGTAAQTVQGKIETDGTYSVSNIIAGPVKIGVQGLETPKYAEAMIPPSEMATRGKDTLKASPKATQPAVKLPVDYGNPEKSGLRYTVTGGSQVYDIDLK